MAFSFFDFNISANCVFLSQIVHASQIVLSNFNRGVAKIVGNLKGLLHSFKLIFSVHKIFREIVWGQKIFNSLHFHFHDISLQVFLDF